MSTEENKALIRYLIEEAFNKGNLDVADEHFLTDYVAHVPGVPVLPRGPGAFKQVIGLWRTAFPDWHMTIEELVAEGDKVTNRFTTRGTHQGPLMGIPPTGKTMVVQSLEMHRIENGKVAESWIVDDVPGIMVQLGILPPPPVRRG